MGLKVAIACDHGGLALKKYLKEAVKEPAIEWLDLGTDTEDSVDYPDYGYKLADVVASGEADYGIAVCGSGIGISMACNRNDKIRAAVCTNTTMARLTRIDNNANIVCLGARVIGNLVAKDIVETFLTTKFESGGRHERRVNKLSK
jgi:ribose 5-phosphate isomerase B